MTKGNPHFGTDYTPFILSVKQLTTIRMACKCSTYPDLELIRESIDKRIAITKGIKKQLQFLSESPSGDSLYKCAVCQQLWQNSRAWNWGNKEYVFKVPNIDVADWMIESFALPDQMLIYSATMNDYFKKNTLVESDKGCQKNGCGNNALLNNVLCREHFIQNLQQFGLLTKFPRGRMFSPYLVGS
ncbi:hypothetical protein [Chryseolinea lacunae]|uniref:Uncharacterized protein n=1 Tax=Chryseolinea lacunae TaxID=2801331 RepID=A0ABS1KU88_9BACT|nr:hypothetical protein [Chryseolinea lacunae]MBL0743035.1 hypothetical protein [Chryseolinea lacunae]